MEEGGWDDSHADFWLPGMNTFVEVKGPAPDSRDIGKMQSLCNDRNCLLFKAPEPSEIKDKIFKFNKKCYKYKEEAESCSNNNKKIINY